MKRRSPRRKNCRVNNTAHRRALANIEVQAKIAELRKQWEHLDRVDRGDRLRELQFLECSTRGLGIAIGVSSTTIRRHLDLANSPERVRELARGGSSVKRIIAGKTKVRQKARREKRVQEEGSSGKHSDAAATLILKFCGPERNLFSGDVVLMLSRTRSLLDWSDVHGRRVSPVPKRLGPEALFSKLRPKEEQDEFWLEHRARWLALVIASRFPERLIWENAIDKATHMVEAMEAQAIASKVPVMGR